MASKLRISLYFELIFGLLLLTYHSSLTVQPVEDNEFEEFDGPKQAQGFYYIQKFKLIKIRKFVFLI